MLDKNVGKVEEDRSREKLNWMDRIKDIGLSFKELLGCCSKYISMTSVHLLGINRESMAFIQLTNLGTQIFWILELAKRFVDLIGRRVFIYKIHSSIVLPRSKQTLGGILILKTESSQNDSSDKITIRLIYPSIVPRHLFHNLLNECFFAELIQLPTFTHHGKP